MKVIDLTGQRFGRLLVRSRGPNSNTNLVRWWCLCDCGAGVLICTTHLRRRSNTKSCGCLQKELAALNMASRTGPASSNWRGGVTSKYERVRKSTIYKDWRAQVYERDNYTCQKCGDATGGKLRAHHMEGFDNNPELRTEIRNGITLCERCHKDFHHQYGYGNNTAKQLNEFLKGEIK